jgi:hypothetical protein
MKRLAQWVGAALAVATAIGAAAQESGAEGQFKGRLIEPTSPAVKKWRDIGEFDFSSSQLSNSFDECVKNSRLRCMNDSKRLLGQYFAPEPDADLVVALYFRSAKGERQFCSGTLVSPTQVLTAGHCGCAKAESYEIYLGESGSRSGEPPIRLKAPPILFDTRICKGAAPFGSDLALLELAAGVACPVQTEENDSWDFGAAFRYGRSEPGACRLARNGETISAAPFQVLGNTAAEDRVLGLRHRLRQGATVRAIGYGYTETGQYDHRMGGDIGVFSAACDEPAMRSICGPYVEMILKDPKKDTCGGDSGGPVFLDFTDPLKRKLIAVTSRALPVPGNDNPRHCGGGGIYTLLGRNSVMGWLAAHRLPFTENVTRASQ